MPYEYCLGKARGKYGPILNRVKDVKELQTDDLIIWASKYALSINLYVAIVDRANTLLRSHAKLVSSYWHTEAAITSTYAIIIWDKW
jgi:hypothetical protein